MAPPPTHSTPTPMSKAIDALTNRVRILMAHLRARGPHYSCPGQPGLGQPPRPALGSGHGGSAGRVGGLHLAAAACRLASGLRPPPGPLVLRDSKSPRW